MSYDFSSTTDTERARLCCEAVHSYIFDKVYNEPVSEYRINILPKLIKTSSCTSTVSILGKNMELPTTGEPYYVWVMSASDFVIGLNLDSCTWVDTATITTDYRTMIHMYGSNGYMFHKASVYLRYNKSRTLIYIAALKNMALNCVSTSELSKCYLTIYYDSDVANPIYLASIYVELSSQMNDYYSQIDSIWSQMTKECQLTVYKNGVEVTDPANGPSLSVGDYIDVIVDQNVLFDFDIDLTTSSENPFFYSEEDQAYKQLIHIPKALNPDNKVITHNTCDFFVRKATSSSTEGLYLHRAAQERSVTQVTHNDMAIQLFVLDAYRDYLQTQQITLHGVVRLHEKNNVLVRDKNFIDLLYNDVHSDDDIIRILTGKGPEDITWWRAEVLEKSLYVKYFFDSPDYPIPSEMANYVEALGYYQVINLLCKRVVQTTITDAYTGTLTWRLPVIYYGLSVVPVAYLNGKYIQRQYMSYTNNLDGTCSVTISDDIYTTPGDTLVIIFYVTGENQIYSFAPDGTTPSITVPYSNPVVYRRVSLSSDTYAKGVGGEYSVSWERLEPSATRFVVNTDDDDNTTLTFSATMYEEEFLICNEYCSYAQTYELDEMIETGQSLVISPKKLYEGTIDPCPILNYDNLSVYLNGVYLVKGIDFNILDVTDNDGNLAAREIIIQTTDHFLSEGNTVDVILNIAEMEDLSSGFVIDGILTDSTPVNLYFENISLVHVDGLLTRDFDYKGVYIQLPEDEDRPQGQIFEIQTSLPSVVTDYVNQYAENGDYERIEIMNNYFYDFINVDKDLLVLESKHRIYSTFMNNVLYDVVNGNLSIINDPDLNRFDGQIDDYLFLQDTDLCFAGLDQRFVDYYPQYINYEIDADTKLLIDKLISTYMPQNQDPTLEVVYDN